MSLNADEIVDRRRLRRKLSFWRVIAVIVAVIAVVAVLGVAAGGGDGVRALPAADRPPLHRRLHQRGPAASSN